MPVVYYIRNNTLYCNISDKELCCAIPFEPHTIIKIRKKYILTADGSLYYMISKTCTNKIFDSGIIDIMVFNNKVYFLDTDNNIITNNRNRKFCKFKYGTNIPNYILKCKCQYGCDGMNLLVQTKNNDLNLCYNNKIFKTPRYKKILSGVSDIHSVYQIFTAKTANANYEIFCRPFCCASARDAHDHNRFIYFCNMLFILVISFLFGCFLGTILVIVVHYSLVETPNNSVSDLIKIIIYCVVTIFVLLCYDFEYIITKEKTDRIKSNKKYGATEKNGELVIYDKKGNQCYYDGDFEQNLCRLKSARNITKL
jgi:hypothetical protein